MKLHHRMFSSYAYLDLKENTESNDETGCHSSNSFLRENNHCKNTP